MKLKIGKSKQETWAKPFSEKVSRRVSSIATSELDFWADNAISDIGRCLNLFNRTGQQNYLDEALVGAEALHAVVDAIHARKSKSS